jgi:hypothetical protein
MRSLLSSVDERADVTHRPPLAGGPPRARSAEHLAAFVEHAPGIVERAAMNVQDDVSSDRRNR